MESKAALGIIGGSGLYRLSALENVQTVNMETPFGKPSSPVLTGEINGMQMAFISRHGEGHVLAPSEVPYAANVCAMKMLGVERLVSISAVGSLDGNIAPRTFVVPHNIIDRTVNRPRTFFGDGVVVHTSLADPFCMALSATLVEAAGEGGLPVRTGGTYVCIEGPQFSTRAESHLFQSWGASIIGMTAMPEARFAREAELCYACLAMVTDYDVWHETEDHVSVDAVVANLTAMTGAVQSIVTALASAPEAACETGCRDALADAILTARESIPEDARTRLSPIAGRYLAPQG